MVIFRIVIVAHRHHQHDYKKHKHQYFFHIVTSFISSRLGLTISKFLYLTFCILLFFLLSADINLKNHTASRFQAQALHTFQMEYHVA